jgi:DNA-binding response OmpR family regulator
MKEGVLKARILAVDDEVHILAVIQQRLESAGYEVITAQDGMEALKKARSGAPDLIILDLILPRLNGYEVCAMLKRDRDLRDVPVLMLTARAQVQDIDEGMKVGADAYMTKPYRTELFLARVAELILTPEKREELIRRRTEELEKDKASRERPLRRSRLTK